MTIIKNDIDLFQERQWLIAAKNDISAFAPIYNRYYDEIYRFLYRRTEMHELAEDLCSETFYKAMSNINKFKWQGKSIGNWLYTIASNVIRKYYRTKKNKRTYVVELDKFEEHANLNEFDKKYTLEDMVWVLEQITEPELMLIELRYFEGKSFRDVSAIMDMKESALKMRLYRLLLTMKNLITRKHDQAGI